MESECVFLAINIVRDTNEEVERYIYLAVLVPREDEMESLLPLSPIMFSPTE